MDSTDAGEDPYTFHAERHAQRMQDAQYAAAYAERRRIEDLRKTDPQAAAALEREVEQQDLEDFDAELTDPWEPREQG